MEQRKLGRSGLTVSRLCFGTLTMSPAQAGLTAADGGGLLAYASRRGINFWDTAEIYETYPHMRAALRQISRQPVISTKTYAYSRKMAEASLEQARRALDLDVIDIFLLHEQESFLTLDGHREALAYLIGQRDLGRIRAVGVSTHAVGVVRAIAEAAQPQPPRVRPDHPAWQDLDPGIYRETDLIHPLLNLTGIGLLDGTAGDMVQACEDAHAAGIGIYGMKMLGGGHLLQRFDEAAAFALGLSCADAYAVGMQSQDEIDMNIALFDGQPVAPHLLAATQARKRRLVIGDWCRGCGDCVRRCGQQALRLEDGHAVVDSNRCVFCGYCATVCRDFVIKVV
ncbi:MAG TPA: aldo/keto reductase [Clostridiales bacterium]|nr:aldo/keto reductase [Clostridiales bacterium]